MTTVTLNGQSTQSNHDSVLALLDELQLTKGRFAVEIDGILVPKSKLAQCPLKDGMQIEVVQAVGGG